MAWQPIFNRIPFALAALCGAIVLAFLGEQLLSPDALNALVYRVGIVPAHWVEGWEIGDWSPILLSLPGHVFVHGGWLHLIFNLVLLVSVGKPLSLRLEQGPHASLRFLAIFFGSALFAALAYVAINHASTLPAIGASGAACGTYSAYLMAVHPDWRQSLRNPIILQNAGMFLFVNVGLAYLAARFDVLPIAWEAHLGGFIGGLVIYPLIASRPTQQTLA